VDDLEAAWIDLHEANASMNWYIGPTTCEERLEVPWSLYAFDPKERPKVGRRSREWTAIGPTEAACVRSMARSLKEIAAGRVPR
jgi:hypothetical protein